MSKLRVDAFAVSLDGYSAGPDQSVENPLGVGGTGLFQWFFATPTFQRMHTVNATVEELARRGGAAGVDEGFAAAAFENVGAWIMGRNMFGPVRGPWPDESWRGWWGESPPYHVPVFVLTHHARRPLEMAGGTVFHFVTDGIEAALARAREAAGARDVRIGGGPGTVRQYLRAGLVDELHLPFSPVLLGRGEPLFAGLDLPALGYSVTRLVPSDKAIHVVLSRRGRG
jgi:dihydrofolate reductase